MSAPGLFVDDSDGCCKSSTGGHEQDPGRETKLCMYSSLVKLRQFVQCYVITALRLTAPSWAPNIGLDTLVTGAAVAP